MSEILYPRHQETTAEHAPFRESPLRGWQGAGAFLMNRKLFQPYDHRHNPLMIYIAGGPAPFTESILAFGPWVLILTFEFVASPLAVATGREGQFVRAMILLQILSPFIVFTQTALLLQLQIRRYFQKLPMEEISLTALSGAEIVHGLIIRPLASLSVILFSTWVLMILGVCLLGCFSQGVGEMEMAVLCVACIAGYFFQSHCMEAATAMGLRANLFIRNGGEAFARATFDWLAGAAVVGANVLLALFLLYTYKSSMNLGPFAPLLIAIFGIVLMPLVVKSMFEGHLSALEYSAGIIVRECAAYRGFWWFATDEGGIDVSGKRFFRSWSALLDEAEKMETFRANLSRDLFEDS